MKIPQLPEYFPEQFVSVGEIHAIPPLSPERSELFKARQQFNRSFDQSDAAGNGTGLEQTRSSICQHLFPPSHTSAISNCICDNQDLMQPDQPGYQLLILGRLPDIQEPACGIIRVLASMSF